MYSLDAPRRAPRRPLARTNFPWVHVAAGAPYFITDDGAAWTPISQNDAITWPDLAGTFRRRDLGAVDRYLATLRRDVAPLCTRVTFPGLAPARYRVTAWDTSTGTPVAEWHHDHHAHGPLTLDTPPIRADLALAVRRG